MIKHLALALAVAAMPVAALGVNFSINGQTSFPVTGQVDYHIGTSTGTGIVEFQASDRFFCFDFGSGSAQVGLKVNDADGAVLLNNVGLSSELQYQLLNDRIRFQSSNSTPCFFTDGAGGFGLFGEPSGRSADDQPIDCDNPDNANELECDRILGDEFQGFPELVIEYSPFTLNTGALSVGDQISYSITIRNEGKVAMQQGAFQELTTIGLLDTASLSCQSQQNSSCGSAVPGNLVRYEGMSLDPGSHVTIEVSKAASQALSLTTEIDYFSGVVSGDGTSNNPVFDSMVNSLVIQ